MILYRYIGTEIIKTKLAVLFVISLIFLSQRFVQFIGKAAAGKLQVDAVIELLLLQLPVLLAFLLPLTIFLATLMALGRMYVDQEFTILKACGVSEIQLARKLLIPLLLLSAVTLYLTLYIAPWAASTQYALVDKQAAQSQVGLLASGQFKSTSDGKGTFYVKEIDQDNRMNQVFYALQDRETESYSVVTANAATIQSTDNGRALILENGHQYEGNVNNLQLSVSQFQRYILRLPEPSLKRKTMKLKALHINELLKSDDPSYAAELQWRISIAISMVLLTLIAIPLAEVKPRQGKFAKILPALMLFIIYMAAMMGVKNLIDTGKFPTFPGLYLVHLGFAIYTASLYLKDSKTLQRFVFHKEQS